MVDSNWHGAKLFELEPLPRRLADADQETDVLFDGEDIELDPNQSLYLGLALHDLAMSAVSPAKRANAHNQISLCANIQQSGMQDHVTLEWESVPGHGVSIAQSDFGSVLLEKIVPAALSGSAMMRQSQNAAAWTREFPLRPAKRSPRRNGRRLGDKVVP